MDGIIIINKEKGYTSHDAVYKIKKMFNTKVGHTGTLDPNATGVLPILLGKGTKLSKYLIEHDKEYEVLLQLGTKTTTKPCFELTRVALNRLEFFEEGKVAFTYITQADMQSVDAKTGDHEGIVEIGRDVEGVEVSIFIRQTEKGCKISLRSNEYVNVSDACVVFGGGGHPRAAGCTIQGTIEQAKEKVIKEVMRLL